MWVMTSCAQLEATTACRMLKEITRDIFPYIATYFIIVIALVMFNITGQQSYDTFNESNSTMGGVFASLFDGWQLSVLGQFDLKNYGTFVSKLVFLLFTAFGNLSETI